MKNLTWPEINRRWKSHYGNILAVVDLLLCLPSSSAECERGFSLIKNIKTDIRNSLKESSLCDFMVIQLESAPIESYDPMEAIHCWNKQPTRGRRPFLNNDGKSVSSSPFGFSNGRTKWMTVTVGWSLRVMMMKKLSLRG